MRPRHAVTLLALLAAPTIGCNDANPLAPKPTRETQFVPAASTVVPSSEGLNSLGYVTTDKGDYAPGAIVGVTGAGFSPGEPVTLSFEESPARHDTRQLTTVADENGRIKSEGYRVSADAAGQGFTLTAWGQTSHISATEYFADSHISVSFVVPDNAPAYASVSVITVYGDQFFPVLQCPPAVIPVAPVYDLILTRGPATVPLDAVVVTGIAELDKLVAVDVPGRRPGIDDVIVTADNTCDEFYFVSGGVFVWRSPNRPPLANAGPDQTAYRSNPAEAIVTFSGSAVDPDGDPMQFAWYEGLTQIASGAQATAALALGVHVIQLRVSDGNGGVDSDVLVVTVLNRPPVIKPGGPYSADEGMAVRLAATATDPDDDALSYAWDFGDGSSETGSTLSASHFYADNGDYTARITVDDGHGGVDSKPVRITISNVPPSLGPLAGPIQPQPIGTTVTVSAPYTDLGSADTHSTAIEWGDGTAAGVASSNIATGTHIYSAAGVYTVHMTVTDDDGGVSNQAVFQYVIVYDPSAGFATGGGWITSPAGAYAPNPALAGKASFGFVAKYPKCATNPSGNTEFQFQEDNLAFQSTSYHWLVVGGAKAQFKGEGAINGGATVYGFLLTAIDGQLNGGGGADRFRLKIWDKTTDAVIYDNQRGAAEDGDAATVLGGGSIVIHK